MYNLIVVILSICIVSYSSAKSYKGAEYRTQSSFTYGRFEVRMKSAAGSGVVSSFFTYHDPYPFSPEVWNEIDIEILGRYQNEIQFNTITPKTSNHVIRDTIMFNPHEGFHIYAIEWTPDYVAWFVDGFETSRQTSDHIKTLVHDHKLMMNLWPSIYNDWVGKFDPYVLPVYAIYDWVKYYTYTPESGTRFTYQWEDQFDFFDTSRWTKATHTFDANSCDFVKENAVIFNGFLILCLTQPQSVGYHGGEVSDIDKSSPYIVWARGFDSSVRIQYSEPVDRVSALNMDNYLIPGYPVSHTLMTSIGDQVILNFSVIDFSAAHILIAQNILDLAPVPNRREMNLVPIHKMLSLPLLINIGKLLSLSDATDQVWNYQLENGAIGGSIATIPDTLDIAGTDEDTLYYCFRKGITGYEIRLPEGFYDLSLMFCETEYRSAGLRKFDVFVEGIKLLADLDIFQESGYGRALEKTFSRLHITDGLMSLGFYASAGETVLHALRITSSALDVFEQTDPGDINTGFRCYPNPSRDFFEVEFFYTGHGTFLFELYDLCGRVVASWNETSRVSDKQRFRLSSIDLPSGVYLLSGSVNRQICGVAKILILH